MLKLFVPSALSAIILATTVMIPPVAAGSTTDFQSIHANLAVYNVTYKGNEFFGQILNKTGKTLKLVKLYYKVLDEQNQIIETGRAWILEDELRGRQTGSFSGQTKTAGTSFIITSAEWL